jgi:pectin methylesterase-like acyl-CoA thioesterase
MQQKLLLLCSSLLLLFSHLGQAQITNATLYDFRDGAIIGAAESPDGLVTLAGVYSHHGTQYGLNMKVDGEIGVSVAGSSTLRFLGSQYSGLNMVGTAAESGDLGTHNTMVANDLSDTYDFVYTGDAAALNFLLTAGSGNDLYLPTLEVIPAQSGIEFATAEENIIYYYDFRDGSIIPISTTGTEDVHLGLVDVLVGPSNAYGYNGAQHGSILKEGNQIVLQVAGNTTIRVGGSIYSNGTIAVSSPDGAFDVSSQAAATVGNFGNDGSTVDFLYVGDAGTVTLDFTGTNYVPYIETVPVPYEVTLTPFVQKSGTITVNDVVINLETGEDATSNATVAVSEGLIISATPTEATISIDLAGEELAFYLPTFSTSIDTVISTGDSLLVTFTDADTDPVGFLIKVSDSSLTPEAEPGVTYTYNFADGSEMPQVSYQALRYQTYISHDGLLTINSNTEEEAQQFGYHDSSHGGVFFSGNSFDMIVAGDAIITFIVDTYGSAVDAELEFTDAGGSVLGAIAGQNIGGDDGFPVSFAYTGPAGLVTATLLSEGFPTAEIYLHGLNIENAAEVVTSNGKTDVWDFGAEQLDTMLYNNQLDEMLINDWYDPAITVGSAGNTLPNFNAGALSWFGGGNDRLRTVNTNLTRYDENISDAGGHTGRIYVNSGGNAGRYLSLTLSEDDEVTIISKTDAGGTINFEYVADPEAQTDIVPIPSDLTELNFVAKAAGTYHVFDTQGKPSYYRVSRKDATYIDFTGAIDVSQAAGIPTDYTIVFTNEAGKVWTTSVTDGAYEMTLPATYTYELSLSGANGYIIDNGTSLEVTETTTVHDITIVGVNLYTVSGSIMGLDGEIANLVLNYEADPGAGAIFVPAPIIDAGAATYSVELEPNILYTIVAEGINDYELMVDTIIVEGAVTDADLEFAAKPVYNVTIDAQNLTAEQLADLSLSFSNLYEEGYVYDYPSVSGISLRDGTYTITTGGVDAYPVELGLTSNLMVAQSDVTKVLTFGPVTNWPFNDREIVNGDPTYKGLLFTGTVYNSPNQGHLAANPGATIQVPANPGETVTVQYYYTADFSLDGGAAITTNSQSTSIFEQTDYVYPGVEPGYVTITVGSGVGTTYFTNISVEQTLPYSAVITVGVDKDYQIINEALAAIRRMDRNDEDRVTILVDPGNYEEMLVIDEPNITLENAAVLPNIDLLNQGVDIAEGAVRVTAYYGHGYDYYSMGNDQKWNADVLNVNQANGYLSYENAGAGTTNGSYWNATVVVTAEGFIADHIIFENSFNQYISQKESQDIVVMWTSGSRGERPTDYGNTDVQDRSFVERGAAIAVVNNTDKVVLNKCRVVGRQDSFYGGSGSRVVVYKGSMMGAVDYLFGGMTAVFYKTELTMNTSDVGSDQAYITAAQQGGGRGYLMYECTVNSALPGTESASMTRSKPGYFGRPWQATTSEVVFYNTIIETSDYPGYEGQSLIFPLGWQNTLGGESAGMYEIGTVENSGADNSPFRASWSTLLTQPQLLDGTDITTFNFTKGNDGWDPLPMLIEEDVVGVNPLVPTTAVKVHAYDNRVYVSAVTDSTLIRVYGLNGVLYKVFETASDVSFTLPGGFWVVAVDAPDGQKAVKVITH